MQEIGKLITARRREVKCSDTNTSSFSASWGCRGCRDRFSVRAGDNGLVQAIEINYLQIACTSFCTDLLILIYYLTNGAGVQEQYLLHGAVDLNPGRTIRIVRLTTSQDLLF